MYFWGSLSNPHWSRGRKREKGQGGLEGGANSCNLYWSGGPGRGRGIHPPPFGDTFNSFQGMSLSRGVSGDHRVNERETRVPVTRLLD